MEKLGLNAAVERINAGAPIPTIEPSHIEYMWEMLSRIRGDTRQKATVGFTSFRGDPKFAPKYHDEQIALSLRYALLDALVERGVLDDYMNDTSARQQIFAAAATIPCDVIDLAEVLAKTGLRDANREVVSLMFDVEEGEQFTVAKVIWHWQDTNGFSEEQLWQLTSV